MTPTWALNSPGATQKVTISSLLLLNSLTQPPYITIQFNITNAQKQHPLTEIASQCKYTCTDTQHLCQPLFSTIFPHQIIYNHTTTTALIIATPLFSELQPKALFNASHSCQQYINISITSAQHLHVITFASAQHLQITFTSAQHLHIKFASAQYLHIIFASTQHLHITFA